MPTEQEVQSYLSDLEAYRQTAIATFGADDAEIKATRGPAAVVTLFFDPDDGSTAAQEAAEEAATAAAATLRGYGFGVQVHSDGETVRAIGNYQL